MSVESAAVAEPAVPVFDACVFEESVWAEGNGAGPEPSAELGFEWLERRPYAVRLWIPGRFEALDSEGAVPVRERVRMGLDRYRAAGIRVAVRFASDLWTLGEGLLRDPDSDQSLGLAIQGTGLWPAATEQPVDT